MLLPKPLYRIGPVVTGLVLLLTGLSIAAATNAQSKPDGKALFERRCGGCHALDRDKEGPRLGEVYGRMSGSVDSFQYSDALKKANVRWGDETLDRWLTDPEKLVPNNDMTFHVESADERSAIIAFLKANSAK
ncbi:MAG TPA: c-type cytochrome [Bryobacteraceae bacterium]|nr:c-type cytochrome [Bryobacteraceae bacterium]